MRTAKFFVFQCYSGKELLFTSYARHGRSGDPVPLSDPKFKITQNESAARGLRLTYCYLAAGLEKAAAIRQVQQLNDATARTEAVFPAPGLLDQNRTTQIHWLPTCGSRLFPVPVNR